MRMRLRVGLILAMLAGPVFAEPARCPELLAAFEGVTGLRISAAPPVPEDGWCIFDRAVLRAEGMPDLAADRLRLRGESSDGDLAELAVRSGGVRLSPGPGQRDLEPVLRETLRLQSAEVDFVLTVGPEGLALRGGDLRLSGGAAFRIEADLAGADLSLGSVLLGRLTWARLDWRNDGRLLRPLMQAWGEGLVDGARGGAAVDASRLAMRHVVANLPAEFLPDEGQARLDRVIGALPQGRGRLVAEFSALAGIGAAELGIAILSGDPLGAEALGRLFANATLSLDWQPGLAP